MNFLEDRNYVVQKLETDACINCKYMDTLHEEMFFDDEIVCGISGEHVSIIGICDSYINNK